MRFLCPNLGSPGKVEVPETTTDPELTINLQLRQNIVNRKDEVGLDIRFSGVQKIHMQMRIWKRIWLWWWCNMAFRLADIGHFHE